MLPLQWSAQEWLRELLLPEYSVSLLHPYFLSGFPAYTACLANQRFIKIWLTEYRQFSRTNQQQSLILKGSMVSMWFRHKSTSWPFMPSPHVEILFGQNYLHLLTCSNVFNLGWSVLGNFSWSFVLPTPYCPQPSFNWEWIPWLASLGILSLELSPLFFLHHGFNAVFYLRLLKWFDLAWVSSLAWLY